MPGIASQDTTIGPINPASLIGRADPVVEPRATAMLGNAFREGWLTADDVINRVGELGKTKDRAMIDVAKSQSMQAQEQMSPEAQAARAAQLGNVVPGAELQGQQIEQQKILMQYPAVAYFQKLAPAAGIEAPLKPDGTPDYAQMEKIGAELAVAQSLKAEAQQQLENITTQDSADGTVLFARTKQGEFVTPEKVRALRAQATGPLKRQTPGTAQVAPVVEAKAPANIDMDAARAQLANSGLPPEQVVQMSPSDITARVSPTPARPPVNAGATSGAGTAPGTPMQGGISLGPPKPRELKAATEAQQRAELALARFGQSNDMLQSLQESGYNPASIGSWMESMLPQILKSGDRKAYEAATSAWSQGLLRLESGAAISRQEKTWYEKAFFPQVNDPPTVISSKEAMRNSVERMVAEIAQQGGVVSPESAVQAQKIYERAGNFVTKPAASAGGGSSAGPIVTLPSGKKITRDSSGNYQYVE